MKLGSASIDYLAGFFDGEGSICIMSRGNKRHGAARLAVVCQCSNTNEAIVREFHARWGGSVTVRAVPDGKRPQWGWQITHAQARRFLEEIGPYLYVKRGQAEIAARFWQTAPPRGIALTDEIAQEREEMKVELSSMNRGRNA